MGDVLGAIAAEEATPDPRLTHVAVEANVPHDRMLKYLRELAELGLTTADGVPRLTAKGREFLRLYRQWRRAQKDFGIDARDASDDARASATATSGSGPTAGAGRL